MLVRKIAKVSNLLARNMATETVSTTAVLFYMRNTGITIAATIVILGRYKHGVKFCNAPYNCIQK